MWVVPIFTRKHLPTRISADTSLLIKAQLGDLVFLVSLSVQFIGIDMLMLSFQID